MTKSRSKYHGDDQELKATDVNPSRPLVPRASEVSIYLLWYGMYNTIQYGTPTMIGRNLIAITFNDYIKPISNRPLPFLITRTSNIYFVRVKFKK